MIPCCVGPCRREAEVLVHFRVLSTPYAYCGWHAYRHGKLRWRQADVRHTETIDS